MGSNMRHTVRGSKNGAYLIEKRHLAELDNAFIVFPNAGQEVSVVVGRGKSYSTDTFERIPDHALAETEIVRSISRSAYSSRADDPFSASISISKSAYSSGGRFSYEASGLSHLVDAFEAKCVGIEKRIRTKHTLLYDWREIVVSLPINGFIYLTATEIYGRLGSPIGRSWWVYTLVAGTVSSIITALTMVIVKRMAPAFVVDVGEGARWYKRATAPWRFAMSKLLAMAFGAAVMGYLGWLGLGKPSLLQSADKPMLQNTQKP